MRKNINFLVQGWSVAIELWLSRTRVRSSHNWVKKPESQTTEIQKHKKVRTASVPSLLKTIFHLFTFLFFASTSTAQLNIDTSYRTSYYDQKVSQFRLLPDTKREIIFLGNSITDIGEWAEIWQNVRVKNRGISSDNTFGVLARLDEVVSSKPAKVFILIGINDISRATPDSVIVANYRKIIQRIQMASPKTHIYIQSILPTNNEFTEFIRHQNKDEHIRSINATLKKLCTSKHLQYVDLYAAFINADGKLDKQYTNDGLHLTGPGFIQWKKYLVEKGYMK